MEKVQIFFVTRGEPKTHFIMYQFWCLSAEMIKLLHVCVFSQERPCSPSFPVLQTGGKAEPSADHGTGTPHPQSAHFQSKNTKEQCVFNFRPNTGHMCVLKKFFWW